MAYMIMTLRSLVACLAALLDPLHERAGLFQERAGIKARRR